MGLTVGHSLVTRSITLSAVWVTSGTRMPDLAEVTDMMVILEAGAHVAGWLVPLVLVSLVVVWMWERSEND